MGHALMENRNGLVVEACLTEANGHAERIAALHMIEPRADRPRPITLGADKAYDAEDFVNELRSMNATPHVAQNANGRSSAIDGRTTRHAGYAVSQRIRKRIEEAFGWIKTIAGQERTRLRGRERVGWAFTFAAAATIWCGCPSSWPPHERPRQVRVDRPLADLRGRYLGSRSPRPLRAGEADDHPRRAAKSPSAPWRPASISNTAAARSASPGKVSTKWTKFMARARRNFSTTAPSRSSSPTTMATTPSSKRNGILLQQPARLRTH
jgi:Transposase DDE domain